MSKQVLAPAIEVRGMEKSYPNLSVLLGVDFDVARGSIFALLGSNGARKTTLIKILSGAGVAGGGRHPDPLHPGADLDRRDPRPHRQVGGRGGLAWCLGIMAVACAAAMAIYRRKTA